MHAAASSYGLPSWTWCNAGFYRVYSLPFTFGAKGKKVNGKHDAILFCSGGRFFSLEREIFHVTNHVLWETSRRAVGQPLSVWRKSRIFAPRNSISRIRGEGQATDAPKRRVATDQVHVRVNPDSYSRLGGIDPQPQKPTTMAIKLKAKEPLQRVGDYAGQYRFVLNTEL